MLTIAALLLANSSPIIFRQFSAPTALTREGDPAWEMSFAGISEDGNVVAGTWSNGFHRGFRFTVKQGPENLFWSRNNMGYSHHEVQAISQDGLTLGGNAIWVQPGTPIYRRFHKGFVNLGQLGLAKDQIMVNAISPHGNAFVATADKPNDRKISYLWLNGSKRALSRTAFSVKVSSDGSVRGFFQDGHSGVEFG